MTDTPNRRRSEQEEVRVGDYFDHSTKRYFDSLHEITVIKVYSGDCYVAEGEGKMMMTILGSCIAACIRDPVAKVGGMNHFLLPSSDHEKGASTRFGAYAMEKLINDLLKCGAHKDRLEVKIFGGANVIANNTKIGERNCEFVREYLKNEGLHAIREDIGGTSPRRVHYYTDTGRVMMRKLNRNEDFENVQKEEVQYQAKLGSGAEEIEHDVELFE